MQSKPASKLLADWRAEPGEKTLGGLLDTVGLRSFALLFVVLLGLPALPLPTGGITSVFEILAMLLALQLIVGRRTVWLPKRWCATALDGERSTKLIDGLIDYTTKIERHSAPRLTALFGHWWSDVAFGITVLVGTIGSFLAPPFSGLDTLPALGVVILSIGVIMEDIAYVIGGIALIVIGITLELTVGGAIYSGVKSLL